MFGEEPRPAYDRVHLSSYVEHRDSARLCLRPAGWYAEHGIELYTGERVERVDRALKEVFCASAFSLRYVAL